MGRISIESFFTSETDLEINQYRILVVYGKYAVISIKRKFIHRLQR